MWKALADEFITEHIGWSGGVQRGEDITAALAAAFASVAQDEREACAAEIDRLRERVLDLEVQLDRMENGTP